VIRLRRSIGYVIQDVGLFPHFTVARNIGLVPKIEGWSADRVRARTEELLQTVGLAAEIASRYPHQLSGGQRQRVGVARALAADPEILLMDEPFGALDPLTRAEMHDMLRHLLASLSKTVLLVTHDLDESLFLARSIVLISKGKLMAHLPAAEFMRSAEPEVAAYIRAYHRGEDRSAMIANRHEGKR
jgi:osmoprotectant transport system ATP-binding protein